MWYVFHGEDEFSRSEAIAALRKEMDPVVGDMNTTALQGRSLSVDELRAACNTVPFLAPHRLVIVYDLFSSVAGGKRPRRERTEAPIDEGKWRDLAEYLPHLPESARLVFAESRSLPPTHPLLALAAARGARVQHFAIPEGNDLERWIEQRARSKGVTVRSEATQLLAEYIGSNLRLLDQELEKLATYHGGQGTVSREDVQRLVSTVREANIFHFVDALGSRDRRRALQLLHHLLQEDGKAPLYLLTMIARQFRLLLQARELEARGTPLAEIARQMELHPKVAPKYLRQAAHFGPEDLRAIMGQLLDIDVGIKTGQVDGSLALELFVIRWTGR